MTVEGVEYTRTLASLTALPELIATLETEMVDGTPAGDGSHTKPTSKPPAPIGILSDIERTWFDVTYYADNWHRFTGTNGKIPPYWQPICDFLTLHWPNMARQHPAAQRFADDINRHFNDLSRHLGDGQRTWQPIIGRWKCPVAPTSPEEAPGATCGGVLLEHMEQRVIICKLDGDHRWTGEAEYERLGAMLGMEIMVTTTQAALIAKVTTRTIQRWIEAGTLPTTTDMTGRELVDKRDLAILVTRRQA